MSFRLEVHADLPSTQDLCAARARAGEAGGLAVLALRQSAGRGRAGRAWAAPEGNLNLSVLLRPAMPQADYGGLALVAGVAAREALAGFLPEAAQPRLKWPNDVLIGPAKLAGILIEAEPGLAILGIGANLRAAPAIAGRPTTAIAEHAPAPAPAAVAARILERLGAWMAAFAGAGLPPVIAAWLAHAHPPGTALSVAVGARRIEGRFHGLSPRGELLLDEGGAIRTVASGEILG